MCNKESTHFSNLLIIVVICFQTLRAVWDAEKKKKQALVTRGRVRGSCGFLLCASLLCYYKNLAGDMPK